MPFERDKEEIINYEEIVSEIEKIKEEINNHKKQFGIHTSPFV